MTKWFILMTRTIMIGPFYLVSMQTVDLEFPIKQGQDFCTFFINSLFYPSFSSLSEMLLVAPPFFFTLLLSKANAPDLTFTSSLFLLHSSAVMLSTSLRVSNLPSIANCGVYGVFIGVYDVRHHPVLPAHSVCWPESVSTWVEQSRILFSLFFFLIENSLLQCSFHFVWFLF